MACKVPYSVEELIAKLENLASNVDYDDSYVETVREAIQKIIDDEKEIGVLVQKMSCANHILERVRSDLNAAMEHNSLSM